MQTITINPLNHTFFFVCQIIYILLSYLTHDFVNKLGDLLLLLALTSSLNLFSFPENK